MILVICLIKIIILRLFNVSVLLLIKLLRTMNLIINFRNLLFLYFLNIHLLQAILSHGSIQFGHLPIVFNS